MTRRRWLTWSAVPVLAVVVVAAKLISLFVLSDAGLSTYRAGRYASAQDRFAHLGVVNVVQGWVSPFDRGDALYRAKSYAAARAEFGRALPLATGEDVCTVRHNLTLAGERIGDAAVVEKDLSAAGTAYERALRDAAACASTADQRARLAELLAAIRTGSAKPTPKPGTSSNPPPPSSQQQLQQRNQDAARNQAATEQGDEESNGGAARQNPTGKDW